MHKYSIKTLVLLATIQRSTHYNLMKKLDLPDYNADLKAEIQAIYMEHEGYYGKIKRQESDLISKACPTRCLMR